MGILLLANPKLASATMLSRYPGMSLVADLKLEVT